MGKGKKMTKEYNNLMNTIKGVTKISLGEKHVIPDVDFFAEDGHTDVASALNGVKVARMALNKMEVELGKLNPEDSLPSWWTNKVAIAIDKLDGMSDYLSTQTEEVELDEMKEPFAVIDTADGNKVVGTASSEKDAKSIITSAELPPMKIKDKKTLKIVKTRKKQRIGSPLQEAKDYEIKNGKVHISKANFRKVHKDFKNSTKGKERMVALDPKSGATKSYEVVFEEVELDEDAKMAKQSDDNLKSLMKKMRDAEKKDPKMPSTQHMIKRISKEMKKRGLKEEIELDEAKSSTGYELYHRDFSSAMKHAYDFAKKKYGITIDKKEIDDKVATGPKKPSKDKTNKYRLLGTDGKKAVQIQVTNLDGKRFELNMYKEEVEEEVIQTDEEKHLEEMVIAFNKDLEERRINSIVEKLKTREWKN
jgi:hypothetical protein|tara:strand:- start:196 stop:1455 length:1260 start_codon:yes stop_codon:yes gene_type:complete